MSVDLTKAKRSEIGEETPTDASKKAVNDIVNDVVESVQEEVGKVVRVKKEAPKKKEPVKKAEEEVEEEEVEEEEVEETEETEEEVTEETEETEEDLIPRSKVQPRIDALTAKIKSLETDNAKLSSKAPEKLSQGDKLKKLSVDELRALRRSTRLSQRSEQEEGKLEQLFELEEAIEDHINNAPQRFMAKQVENLDVIAPELAKIDPEIVNQKGVLFKAAQRIFLQSKALQASPMGQVEAALLAAEHFALVKTNSNGKEKETTLSRQVQTLKKKTSLAGKTHVAGEVATNNKKLYEKAKTGNILDKEHFFKEAIVASDYLED